MASRLVGAATGQGAEGRRPPAPFRSSPRCPVAVAVGPVPGLQPASPGSILPLPSKSVWPLCLAPRSPVCCPHSPTRPPSLPRGPSEPAAVLPLLWGSQERWATPRFSKYSFLVSRGLDRYTKTYQKKKTKSSRDGDTPGDLGRPPFQLTLRPSSLSLTTDCKQLVALLNVVLSRLRLARECVTVSARSGMPRSALWLGGAHPPRPATQAGRGLGGTGWPRAAAVGAGGTAVGEEVPAGWAVSCPAPGAGHHRPPVRPACAAAPGAWCVRAEDPSPGVELCLV